MPRKLITKAEYARRIGVNQSTITRQIARGIIKTHGAKKLIDPAEADAARSVLLDPSRGKHTGKKNAIAKAKKLSEADAPMEEPTADAGNAGLPPQNTFAGAKLRRELILAARQRFELDLRMGLYLLKAEVEKAIAREGRSIRDSWLNWPSRISAQLAAQLKVPEDKLFAALEAAVLEHLDELGEVRVNVDQAVSNGGE